MFLRIYYLSKMVVGRAMQGAKPHYKVLPQGNHKWLPMTPKKKINSLLCIKTTDYIHKLTKMTYPTI